MTEIVVEETGNDEPVANVELSHLSIEVGHLYLEDLVRGRSRIDELIAATAPWAEAATRQCATRLGIPRPRISTCFMIDDYFGDSGSPRTIVPQILEAASEAGLTIDYLARESACAVADGVDLATLVLNRLVPDPPRGANGRRPDVFASGWLSNGEPSPPPGVAEAMREEGPWRPPIEHGAKNHAVFVDVQLWDMVGGQRRWSCPYLASVWQLLRLGQLRHSGVAVGRPRAWDRGELPESWHDLPPVMRLSSNPAPFFAYRTLSILDSQFIAVEQAVRVILSQVDVGEAVTEQTRTRAARERRGRQSGIDLPAEIVNRLEYVFVGPPWY
jgi:hypothetical protein